MGIIPTLLMPFELNWTDAVGSTALTLRAPTLHSIRRADWTMYQQVIQVLNTFLLFVSSAHFTIWESFHRKRMRKRRKHRTRSLQIINRRRIFLKNTVLLPGRFCSSGLGKSSDFFSTRKFFSLLFGSFDCQICQLNSDKTFIFT